MLANTDQEESAEVETSVIYCGDCFKQLKKLPENCIDLVYIDPPFNSNRNYEVFWGDTREKRAFEDRFGDAEHYVNWMTPRLIQLHRILKNTGSFYYHCDWHASHYVKIRLDQLFGFNNFQNEVIWFYKTGGASRKRFSRKHDTIFFYTRSKKYIFNLQKERSFMMHKYGFKKSDFQIDEETGLQYSMVHMKDVWEIPSIGSADKQRLGYPTQKPLPLIERIVKASSNMNNIVLDAFCGCGTTLIAAEKYKRRWIGIDISPTACRVMAKRLKDIFGLREGRDFFIRDMPKTIMELKKYPPFEFQNWAINALGGIPSATKVGDKGIDGYLYPSDIEMKKEEGSDLFGDSDRRYPVQVKQHQAGRPDIDKFETAMRRDKRNIGFFVALSYSRHALREIERFKREEMLTIIPLTVQQIIDEETDLNI